MQFENITIQKQTDKESYAGVCEDYHLGMTIIFYVINIADYAKSKWLNYSNRQITKIKFSALSVAGTVLLGMHHSKHQIAVESKGRNRRNQLLDALGDPARIRFGFVIRQKLHLHAALIFPGRTADQPLPVAVGGIAQLRGQ